MKLTTKQDFIEENQEEEEIKIQRKIKVIISDPDATESSSDDEQERRPKMIVHEILQKMVKIQPLSIKNRNPIDFNQFSGKLPPMVHKRKSGKFGTEIRNPFNKKRIWLGSFDTAEEASQAYQSKKLEFEEELKKAKNVIIVKKAISAKSEIGSSSRNPPLMIDSNNSESSNEFDERLKKANNAKVKKAISAKSEIGSSSRNPPLMIDSQTSNSSKLKIRFSLKNRSRSSFDQFSGKLPPMIRKRKSGKFGTEIRNPFTKKRIWLGTFNTAEEASEVYQSKKLEFEEELKKAKNANVSKVISAKSEIGPFSSDPPLVIDSQNSNSSNKLDELLKKDKNAKSEIGFSRNPPLMVDSQTTGSSNELDEPLKKAKNAKVKKVISAKSKIGSSRNPPLMVDSQTKDSSNELDEPLKKAKNAIVKKAISAKIEIGSSPSSSDPPLMVDSQTPDSSNGVEEELWMGQWIQISDDKEVKFSQKLGVPVVDNYGFLLGEFSKLDDLSISV